MTTRIVRMNEIVRAFLKLSCCTCTDLCALRSRTGFPRLTWRRLGVSILGNVGGLWAFRERSMWKMSRHGFVGVDVDEDTTGSGHYIQYQRSSNRRAGDYVESHILIQLEHSEGSGTIPS